MTCASHHRLATLLDRGLVVVVDCGPRDLRCRWVSSLKEMRL